MTQQIIDIGIQGNDGTGDSIRTSFNKVNQNFSELYSIFGEGTIRFTNLSDAPTQKTYAATSIITSGSTATITFTNPNPPTSNESVTLHGAPFAIGQTITINGLTGNVASFNGLQTVTGSTASSVSFARGSVSQPTALTVYGYVHDVDPYNKNQLIMVDNAGQLLTARNVVAGAGISIDASSDTDLLISSTVTGLFGDSKPELSASINANGFAIANLPDLSNANTVQALISSFNLNNSTSLTDDSTFAISKGYADKTYIQTVNGTLVAPLISRSQPSSPQVGVTGYDATLTSNYLSTEVMQRKDVVYRGGDTMTGALTLSDHPTPLNGAGIVNTSEDLQAATKYYVDNNTYYSGINLYVSATKGDDLQTNTPAGREGRAWHYAYKTIGAAALQADTLISLASIEPGPYRQTITWTNTTTNVQSDSYLINPNQGNPGATPWLTGLSGGNSAVQWYLDAAALLELNKEFIQYETIAYLNKKYVNSFTYDKVLYSNIISNILTAVGYDLTFNTTYNVTAQTQYLFSASNTNIIQNQLSQIIDGINFAKSQITSYTYNTSALQSYVGQIVDALCYDLIFGSNYRSIQAGLNFNINGSQQTATGVNSTEIIDLLDNTIITATAVLTTGSSVTINFATEETAPYVNGSYIIVSGMTPSSYNGVWQVTACTTSSVTFTSALTANVTVLGSIVKNNLINNIIINSGTNSPTIVASLVDNATLISNIVKNSITPTPTFPTTPITTADQYNAAQLLLNNIEFIQAEITAFIAANYPSLDYNVALSKRDTGYIIWSIVYDLMYGGNSQSVYAGLGYWKTSSVSYLSSLETPVCVAVINYIDNLAQAIINNVLIGSASALTLSATYTTNSNGIVTVDFTGQSNVPFSPGQFIVISNASQSAFNGTYVVISSTTSSVSFVGTQSYAGVLTGTIVGSAGVLYQQSVQQYTNDTYSVTPTTLINSSSVLNTSIVKSITNNLSTIATIVGSVTEPSPSVVQPEKHIASFTGTISGTTLTVSNVTGTIAVGQTIYAGASTGTTITGVLSATTYSVSISQTVSTPTYMTTVDITRQARIAIEATNNSTGSGLQTVATNFINSNFPILNNYSGYSSIITTINTLFGIITAGLTNGLASLALPVYNSPTNNATGYSNFTNARLAILANLSFIEIETLAWMKLNAVSIGYTSSTSADALVKSSIQSLLEAICFDLTYCNNVSGSSGITAGNYATVNAANLFWVNGISIIPGLNLSGEAYYQGLTHAQSIVVAVATNTLWSPVVGTATQTQNSSWAPTTPDPITPSTNINNLFANILDIISTNDASTYTVGSGKLKLPNTSLVNSSLVSTQTLISQQNSIIAQATINYLTNTYTGGYQYNESLCFRDLGTIIDGQVIDLLTGGNAMSVISGKSFYKNSSALKVFSSTPSMDALMFAENLALQVLNQTSAQRYQTAYSQYTSGSYNAAASSGIAITTFTNNFDVMVSIINNGVGSAPAVTYGTGIWTMTLSNGGYGYVDQGGNVTVGVQSEVHIIPGKILVGNISGANGEVVSYTSAHDGSTAYDTITYRMLRPGFFNFDVAQAAATTPGVTAGLYYGESVDFGETVPAQNISIFVETGVYYEDYPIKLANNVTISGDDFRRTIVRPLNRISQSPWRNTFFYRDSVIDGLQTGVINFTSLGKGGADYAISAGTTATISGQTGNITVTLGNNVQALSSWIGLIFTDGTAESANGGTSSYDGVSAPGKAIINSISGNVLNCTVIYPFPAIGTYAIGSWHLFNTINYGYHYLTDPTQPESLTNPAKNNKDMDVFLCNDATRVRLLTCQGHGGFMMVLDPTGQIKSKSPYAQEAASFTASLGIARRFAGGQLIDGFAGRLYGTVISIANLGQTITVFGPTGSGLDIRPPQVPCAFYVAGNRYQINDVVPNTWGPTTYNGQTGGQVTLTLDNSTPFYLQGAYSSYTSNFSNQLTNIIQNAALDLATTVTATISGSIVNNTLTVTSVTGTIFVGMYLSGTNIYSGTYITAGSGSSWTVSYGYATTTGTQTITGTLYSNYKSIIAGSAYLQPQNQLTSIGQLLVQQGISNANLYLVANANLSNTGDFALTNNLNLISSIVTNGQNAIPSTIVYPGITSTANHTSLAANILQKNMGFIQAEMASWINSNYNIQNYANYSSLVTQQDAYAIVNAITYDLMYGGNSAIFDQTTSYYYSAGQLATTTASFNGYISGTTLTVVGSVSKVGVTGTGTIAVGQLITGANIVPGTTITSGSGTSWTINYSQTTGSSGSPVPIVSTSTTYTLSNSALYTAAYAHLNVVIQQLIVNQPITPSAGNQAVQNVSLTTAADAVFTGYISGTTLHVTSVSSGTIAVYENITGVGIATNTYITANLTGSGSSGASTWTINTSQSVASSGSPITISSTRMGYLIGNGRNDSNAGYIDVLIGYVSSPATFVLPTRSIPTTINGTALSSNDDYTDTLETLSATLTNTINTLNSGANILVNIEMGGNKSMLASDFTQINDLAYGIVCTNAAQTEQVSTFTYYNYTGFYALNGAAIRAVACSNCTGTYGLRASGSDVTELPDAVNLYDDMIQSAHVYKQGEFISTMTPTATTQALNVYIVGWQYIPMDTSELEIDHTAAGGGITRYEISTVTHTNVTINGKNVLNLTLSTSGDNSTTASGLAYPLYDGQVVTIRMLQNFKFENISNVQPVRPSTALQFTQNLADIYRIISYNLTESTGEIFAIGTGVAILSVDSSFNYYQLLTDSVNITQADPLNPTVTATIVSGSTGSLTITVNNVVGTITAGMYIGGIGFNGQIVTGTPTNMSGTWTVTLLGSTPSLTPVGPVYFSTRTQGANSGDTKIAILPITSTPSINQLNKGIYIFGWNGRTHRVVGYTANTSVATGAYSTYTNVGGSTPTINVTNVLGSIYAGQIVTGTGFNGTQYVKSVTFTTVGGVLDAAVVLTVVPSSIGSLGGTVTFGTTANSYVTIDPNPIYNNSAIGTSVNAMTYVSQAYVPNSTSAKILTFNIPYNATVASGYLPILPPVDSSLTITGNSNTAYNGTHQVVGITNSTTIYTTSVASLSVGMVVSSVSTTYNITGATYSSSGGGTITFTFNNAVTTTTPYQAASVIIVTGVSPSGYNGTYTVTTPAYNSVVVAFSGSNPGLYSSSGSITNPVGIVPGNTIIQSINSTNLSFVVAPAIWVPAGATLSAIAEATLLSVYPYQNIGSGYTTTNPPTVTLTDPSTPPVRQAQVVATVNSNGSITLAIIDPGYGYTIAPTVSITGGAGSVGGTIITATLTATPSAAPVVSSGITTMQMNLLYNTDPGITGSVTSVSATGNYIYVTSTTGLIVGNPITFSGSSAIGNISTSTTYYILTAPTGTQITVSVNPPPGNPLYAGVAQTTFVPINSGTANGSMGYYSPSFGLGTSLTISGTPVVTGTGPYTVTFTIPSTAVTSGTYYQVSNNTNSLYNGIFPTTSSGTVTSIALTYQFNPGTWSSSTTTYMALASTQGTSNTLGISKPFVTTGSTTLRAGYAGYTGGQITVRISTTRATGHDFLDIGTGGFDTTNYPNQIYGNPAIPVDSSKQVLEEGVGRAFYVSTDENGIFKVGRFFQVDQGTGTVTFSASIALSNLDGLGFKRGVVVTEFSTDETMTENAPEIVPVQSAVRGFVDLRLGLDYGGNPVPNNQLIGYGYMSLGGGLAMKANMNLGNNSILNLTMPSTNTSPYDAANRQYVDTSIGTTSNLFKLKDVGIGATATFVSLSSNTLTVSNISGSLLLGQIVSAIATTTAGTINNGSTGAGNNFTASGNITGTFAIGMLLTGTGITTGTYINGGSANISGGGNFTVAGAAQLVASETVTGDFFSGQTITNIVFNALTGYTAITLSSAPGTTPTGQPTITFNNISAGNFLVYDATLEQWANAIPPTGTSNGNQVAISYTPYTSPNNGYLTATIQSGVITNSMVNASAAIVQSKLLMQAAGTLSTSSGITQANLGLAAFSSNTFSSTNGWIDLATNGVIYAKIQQMPTNTVLGNFTSSTATPTAVSSSTIVSTGGGLLSASFTGSGLLSQTSSVGVTSYGITAVSSSHGNGVVVQSAGSGATYPGQVDVTSLAINGDNILSINSLDNVTLQFNTPGQNGVANPTYFMTASGIPGSGAGIQVTLNGIVTVSGTLDVTTISAGAYNTNGQLTGNWKVTNQSIFDLYTNSATLKSGTLTTGSTSNPGTITGAWSVTGSITIPNGSTLIATNGQIDATNITTGSTSTPGTLTGAWTISGSLISTNLSAGSSTTAGTLIGNWSPAGGSTLAATTASLATSATTATNLSGTTANTIPYQTGTATAYTPAPTDGTILKYTTASGFTWVAPTVVSSVSTVTSGGTVTTNSVTTPIIYASGGSPSGGGSYTNTGTIYGTWSLSSGSSLQATYADLAEWYTADTEYEPGTVLVFGGDAEVTTTDTINDTRCAGVVTTNPAYVLNGDVSGTKACLALVGRVPCKVVGRVKKGDILTTSATPGYAVRATTPTLGAIVGKALQDKDYGEAGVIEIAVGRA